MNDKELEISSISYTNKDFGSIYPEILDIAKNLTTKWDPSHSDESDPGVVLLKEAAFCVDHNNYNIDKNILENFLPSATQNKSVRNITEMNGYTPRYYISANGKVTLIWKYDSTSEETNTSFTIPAFTLTVSNSDGTISYIQNEDITIYGDSIKSTGKFIEGSLQTLNINGSSVITIENIDDNNRIYFPSSMIAQNGIYIKYYNDEDNYGYWENDSYLLTRPAGSRVYKVDYDSDLRLPYIEFPSDISNIINDGLVISYIETSGTAGNVSSKSLIKIASPTDSFVDTAGITRSITNFTLYNSLGITNGKDPETINEMYQSFKKIVGTFDTLVTCKDYSNRVYSLQDSNGNPYVSNGLVADRRIDYNRALNVITLDDSGEYFKNISLKKSCLKFRSGVFDVGDLPATGTNGDVIMVKSETSELISYSFYLRYKNNWIKISDGDAIINLNDFAYLTEAMTPYDLVMYCLAAYSAANYNSYSPSIALEKSFLPIDETTKNAVLYDLSESKCISHTFKDPDSNDVFCFKNFAPLNVTITPYNKLEKAETAEILDNIYKNISENFNPRNLNFGEKLDVNTLKTVIIGSDDRIKNVDIAQIQYNTNVMNPSGVHTNIFDSGSTYFIDLITKNILAGRLCLFSFNTDFNYAYGQYNGETYSIIQESQVPKTLSTKLPIKVNSLQSGANATQTKDVSTIYKISSSGYSSEQEANVKYIFNAPLYLNEELLVGSSYTLQQTDSLIVFVKVDGLWKSSEYKNTDSKVITVYNGLSSEMYNDENSYTASEGYIQITETTTEVLTDEGIVNVDNYLLRDNEAVQIIYPNYYSIDTYGVYVNYRYENSLNKDAVILANTEHTLGKNERILLSYTSNGVSKLDKLTEGTIINSSFNLGVTDTLSSTGTKVNYETENGMVSGKFMTLSSNQTISTRALMQTKLTDTSMNCIWITNTISIEGSHCILFNENDTERILGNNEYFIYSNSSLDEIVILGSGTKIERTGENLSTWACEKIDISVQSITENGIPSSFPWVTMNFNANNLYITEMNVVTLGKGDSLTITGWSASGSEELPTEIKNSFVDCYANITYTSNGETVTLLKTYNFYKIRSRLDLAMSKDAPQLLVRKDEDSEGNVDGEQIVMINDTKLSAQDHNKDYNFYIQSSENLNVIGDDLIDLSSYSSLKVYAYESMNESFDEVIVVQSTIYDSEGKPSNMPNPYPFFYNYMTGGSLTNNEYIIPIYISGNSIDINAKMYYYEYDSSGSSFKVNVDIVDYNNDSLTPNQDKSLTLTGNSLYNITPINIITNTELYLQLSWNGVVSEIEKIIVKPLTINVGLNKELSSTLLPDIKEHINYLISNSDMPSVKPHYTYVPDNSMVLNNQNFTDPNIMWDINNVANGQTIAQIDLAESSFTIDPSMRNY